MKRIEIINMYGALSQIRLAGMTDAGVKSALISAHLNLYRPCKDHDDFCAGLSERFTPDEMDAANEAYQRYLDEDVDVTLDKIGRGDFAREVGKTETGICLDSLKCLEPLFQED